MKSNHQQQYGQFMTEDSMAAKILHVIDNKSRIGGRILEPSFGKGSFIKRLADVYSFDRLDGYEIDPDLYSQVTLTPENIHLYCDDFLLNVILEKYDHVVGNPPFVEVNYSYYSPEMIKVFKDIYQNITDGRLNLVHMFIYESSLVLKPNGYLSFLLPSVILTSPYYTKLRKFIYDNFTVEYVRNDMKFAGIGVKVSLLILKKSKDQADKYFVNYGNQYYITDTYMIYPPSERSLKDAGFIVSIGDICWNHHKSELTDDSSYFPVLYTKNIVNNKISLDVDLGNSEKKQYIKKNTLDPKYKNFIAFPRTNTKNLKFVYVKDNHQYHVENHLLTITHENIEMLDNLYEMFVNGEMEKYLELFQTSKTWSTKELYSIPI